MNHNNDYISLDEAVETYTALDTALDEIFTKQLKVSRPGGPSQGSGWSKWSTVMKCPYLYKRKYVDKPNDEASGKALEVGGLFHQLLALYYLAKILGNVLVGEEWLKQRLLDLGVNPEVIMEGFRLYDAYLSRYHQDYLTPLAVEYEAWDETAGNSTRYDLIARVEKNEVGLPMGICVVEHKTASRFDAGTLEGWRNDGQILLQEHLWTKKQLYRKFGKLEGILVNIVGKQMQPQFHRTLIPPQKWQLSGHVKDLRVWKATIGVYEAFGHYPRNRQSCVGRYGKCELFSECAGE